jgi:hypothetical protein
MTRQPTTNQYLSEKIRKLHAAAVNQNKESYIDPDTGFVVFTEVFHLKRGYCCGSKCRHCPFNHENVKE